MLGNQVVLASPVGRLTQIDFETGEIRAPSTWAGKLTRSPVADETGKFLYVMGDEANLFLIALERNRMSCTGVEYIGHAPGSIPCAPARIGRFLVVVENQTMLDGRWIVYLLDEDGSRAKKVQQIPISGWTWATPPTSGKNIWSVGDRGGVSAYTIGPYDKADPFRLAGQVVPDAERSGPAYGRARSERELWRSSSLSAKFDLDPERTSLAMGWTLQEAGPSLGPIQQADRLIAFTHQYSEGQGVALWGVNPADGKVAWRTVLGTPWVSPPVPAADGNGLTLAANDGRPMTIPLEKLKAGGFIAQPINKPGSPKFLSAGATMLPVDGLTITVPSSTSDHYLLSEGGGAPTRINLTEALAAAPAAWKGGLVLPAANGWVYWVDPRTGEPKADPYMPAYDRSKPIQWRPPLVLDDESILLVDSGGRIHRLVIRDEPRPRLVAQPADPLDVGNAIVADPLLVGDTAVVTTADDRVRGISIRDLGVSATWKLEGARAAGPYRFGPAPCWATNRGGCWRSASMPNRPGLPRPVRRRWPGRPPSSAMPPGSSAGTASSARSASRTAPTSPASRPSSCRPAACPPSARTSPSTSGPARFACSPPRHPDRNRIGTVRTGALANAMNRPQTPATAPALPPGGRNPAAVALRAGFALLVGAVMAAAATIPPTAQNPAPAAGQAPAGKVDLLKTAPFDRVTLIDNKVFSVEPLSPRPIPPPPAPVPDSKKAKAVTKQEQQAQLEAERQVIRLTEGDYRDFWTKRASIKSVEYFEDMLLAEGDRLLRDGNYAKAFEYYLAVKDRSPRWKGLEERIDKLLFEEGNSHLVRGETEQGLRLIRELYERRPDYPNLGERLARAYSDRINKAIEKGHYAEGRQALHDLEALVPNHVLAKEGRNKFIAKAQTLADRASKKQGDGQLSDLSEALRVWPELDGAASKYSEAFSNLPTLEVGVLDVPRPRGDDRDPTPGFGPWIRTRAEARLNPLVFLPLLARDDEAAARGAIPGQLVADLEITDIGRTVIARLKPGIAWADGSRPLTSLDVARSLSDRAMPRSPSFHSRWANMLDRLEAIDDERVTIRLSRPILKPESWLVVPVGPAHAGRDGLVPVGKGRSSVGNGPFRVVELAKSSAKLRSLAEDPSGSRRVRNLHESRMPNATAAISAMLRGQVAMLEHVPTDRVADLAQDPDIKLGRYAQPSLHRIVFDGRNPALRSRSLRRGLAYAIDRKALLEETILRRPADARNLLADGPFPADSYANAPNIRGFDHDPLMAKMLVAGGRKEAGVETVRLRFEYPSIPEAQAVAPKIAEMFREAGKIGELNGLQIDLVERRPDDLERELRAGRKFDIVYLADRVSDPAMEAGPLICPGYDAPPTTGALAAIASPRILQLLLQLDLASDPPAAKELLQQIDREARDELPILPLWQLDEIYAWRSSLVGPPAETESLYQGIETWEIKPWIARDPWASQSAPPAASSPSPSPPSP
ncbi:MAG: ABC transporter substrate-binding protein [Isosphaeraceae bacterium]